MRSALTVGCRSSRVAAGAAVMGARADQLTASVKPAMVANATRGIAMVTLRSVFDSERSAVWIGRWPGARREALAFARALRHDWRPWRDRRGRRWKTSGGG